MNLKPGVKTSELWLIVLVQIGNLAAALSGDLAPRWAALASAVSAAAYALGRGWAKSQPAVVPVVTAPPGAAVVPAPPDRTA